MMGEYRRAAAWRTVGSKVTGERVALLVAGVLLAAAAVVTTHLALVNVRASKDLQMLREENKALRRNATDWELHGGKCYHLSSNLSSWDGGRRACQAAGGDLVKVDSQEEQRFLVDHLSKNLCCTADHFWIGLTDAEVEGRWVWVDGSPLNQSWSFWNGNEPDDWTQENPEGEDCVRMGLGTGDDELKTWFDRSCLVLQRFICEKRAGGDTCP